MLDYDFKHIGAGGSAFGREIAAGMGADGDGVLGGALGLRVACFKRGERCQFRQRRSVKPLAPLALGEIEPVRRQRFVRRAAAIFAKRVFPRLIIVGDLLEPLMRGFLGQWLEGEWRRRQIIEKCFEALMKQRQPMLHAGVLAALAHSLVERIVRRRGAELRHVAGAKGANGVAGKLKLGDRNQIERAQLARGALRLRIEAADRFQRVAKKIEPHRLVHAGRVKIDDAAAHGVIAGFAHRGGAVEAVELEPLDDVRHRRDIAGRDG